MVETRRQLLRCFGGAAALSLAGCTGLFGGRRRWRFGTGHPTRAGPTLADGAVHVGNARGTVTAVDVESGEQRWQSTVEGDVRRTAAARDGTVYVASGDPNTVTALDAATGDVEWTTRLGGERVSPPTLAGDRLYVGSDTRLHALAVGDGDRRWTHANDDARGFVRTKPTIVEGMVYATSVFGRVFAVDASTGTPQWTVRLPADQISAPTVSEGALYVATDQGTVYAFDATDGRQRWTATPGGGAVGTAPLSWRDGLHVAGADGAVHVLKTDSGTTRRRIHVDTVATTPPVVADGTLYLGDESWRLHAIDLDAGERTWQYEANAALRAEPAVSDRLIIAVDLSGDIHALSR